MFEKLGLHDLIRVLKFVKPRALSYYFGIISYSLTEASTFILIPIIIKFMLDAAIKGDMSILNRGEVIVGLVVATSSFIFIGIIILFWSTVHRTVTDIKILSLRNVVRYPVSFFEKTHSGDLISRLTNDVNVLYGSLGMGLREILFICISGIGSAVVMIVLDWRFSIILLTVGIISTIVNAKFSSKIRDISDILQKSTGELTMKVSDMLAGVRIMKIFQIEKTLENKFTDKNNEIQTLEFSRFKTSAALESTNFVIKWINFVGIIVIGALFSIQGKVDIGTVVAEIYLLGNVNNMISNVGSLLGALQGSLAGAARVMELLDMPAEVESYIAE